MRILIVLFFLFSIPFYGQENEKTKLIYKAFDQIVGLKNTDLGYGKIYVEKFRVLEGFDQYFFQNDFIKGDVTYQNQTFYDALLKYDLDEDELIVNIPSTFESKTILLEKAQVKRFTIHQKNFINTEEGFLEIIHSSDSFSFFKKNTKEKKKKLDKSFLYYKFIEKDFYLLKKENSFYEIKNKKDIYKLFPGNKKEIISFYKTNKGLQKSNLDRFYKLLCQQISKKSNLKE